MTHAVRVRPSMASGIMAVILGLAMLTGPGCGKEQDMSGPGPSPEFPFGSCDITISGAVETSYRSGGGPANVATVYWMTDDELRAYFAWRARAETKLGIAEEDVPFFVDQAMAKNPRFVTLLIKCPSPTATITLVPGLATRYEDVPFRPGSYKIAPSRLVDETLPGLFAAQPLIVRGERVVQFTPQGFGSLVVEAFDAEHIAGNFRFEALDGPAAITVEGAFHFRRRAVSASGP
ncbi:MAG: hypothetical protein AB1806_09090 [Acidobacteriota bacterium]